MANNVETHRSHISGTKRLLEPAFREPKRPAWLFGTEADTEIERLVPDPYLHDVSREADRSPLRCLQYGDCDQQVCFGTICSVLVQMRNDPLSSISAVTKASFDKKGTITLYLAFVDGLAWVNLDGGDPFGCLTSKAARILRRLDTFPCVELDVLVSFNALEKARTSWKRSGSSARLHLDINVYGHRHAGRTVGRNLSSSRTFLQQPENDARVVPYENPQYLKLPGVADMLEALPLVAFHDQNAPIDTKETTTSEIEALLDHLPQPSFLQPVITDARIITPLVKHQKEAVDFMTRRETGDLPPSMSLWKFHTSSSSPFSWRHIITGANSQDVEDISGGLLADDMGLGKTLSTLAIIVASLNRALQFAISGTNPATTQWQHLVPSKATLVIVPSALLLDSWSEEIRKHVFPGTLAVHRYHGAGKMLSLLDLLQYDIVLTTYATVAAEFCRGRSILDHVEWYRIVLDEAHVIRNSSTKQFRAISSIAAHIRWCLTGTPIQNGVEDLGALVKFLRVPYLVDTPTFRKYITTMVHSKTPNRFVNLRRLLEALCLRRTRVLLRLPDPVTETQHLSLSTSERQAYKDYGEGCKQALNTAISGHSIKKANQIVIETSLRMRLFCNNGTAAFSGKWNLLGMPSDPQEALSYLQGNGKEPTCAQCDCEITSMYQEDDRSSGVLTKCQHLLCGECLPTYKADLEDSVQDGRAQCPICGQSGEKETFALDPSTSLQSAPSATTSYPTKLLALLRNIQKQQSKDKCIVFSFWKKTLDIIADMLTANCIAFLRVHGSLSAGKRASVLSDFEIDPSVRVLLITFGTGAVGINKLVVANHIHIVEPQWNPSVESQAIGRILRFGQEKLVTIIRYVMKDTVEEAVQSRQLRKLQLARGGFGLGKDDEHTSQRIEEIMLLLCPTAEE